MWTLSGFADEISSDLDEQVALLGKLGMSHLEFRSAWGTNVLDLDAGALSRAKGIVDDAGLAVSSIGSPIGKIHIEGDFAAHLDRARHALDVAHHFGAPYVRVFSFFVGPGDADRHRDEVLRRMRALADLAEEREVVLVHENEKEIYGDVPRRCADILASVASPNLRAAWDAANFVQVGVRPFSEAYAAVRPYLDYVQIKDALLADGEVRPAGRGDGEMVETLRALRSDGFDGFFSLEPHLSQAHSLGGFSGPELFTEAWEAFTGLLGAEGIEYR